MYCNVERQTEKNRQKQRERKTDKSREREDRDDLVVEHESAGEIPAADTVEARYLGFICVGLSKEGSDCCIPPEQNVISLTTSHEQIRGMLGAWAPNVWECL